jgi:RNA polymerase sigma-70 factor (ECF subfamily)
LTEQQQYQTDLEEKEQQSQSYHDLPSLYHAYARRVFHYHYARVQNQHEAEDLTSQTFMAAWEQWHNLRDPKKAVGWLFSIARNKNSDHFRNRQHIQHEELHDKLANSANPISSETIDRLLDLQLHIDRLTEKDQDLIRLRSVAELPFKQISQILHEPETRIKKRHYRLLQRLKAEMEQV